MDPRRARAWRARYHRIKVNRGRVEATLKAAKSLRQKPGSGEASRQ